MNVQRYPFVIAATALVSIVLAYLAGVAGVGAAEPAAESPIRPGEVVARFAGLDDGQVIVREYNEGSQVCVVSNAGMTCTKSTASVPMIAFVDTLEGSFAIVVDPTGRTSKVSLIDDGGDLREIPADTVATAVSLADAATIDVRDAEGKTLFSADLNIRTKFHELAEDSVDAEPHH